MRDKRDMNKTANILEQERQYYYRPCQFDGGLTLKCAGFGAEDESHRAFYLPHFDKCDDGRHHLPGTVILQGYHGDKISSEYANANKIN